MKTQEDAGNAWTQEDAGDADTQGTQGTQERGAYAEAIGGASSDANELINMYKKENAARLWAVRGR